MTIDDLMYAPGADVYYSKAFRDMLESHMVYFRTASGTSVIEVESQKAEVYDGDLFGFLHYQKIQAQLHWLIMRINNFYSPFEFGPGCTTLLIPAARDVESLRQSQQSSLTGTITF